MPGAPLPLSVIGGGYVGLTTAACLAELGHEVWVVEIDGAKLARLRRGEVPFYEPGLAELVRAGARSGRLRFTDSYGEAIPGSRFAFIAVSTPPREDGDADLTHVQAAAREIGRHLREPLIVVNKSTVPIGTAHQVAETVSRFDGGRRVAVASNPEFLREGSALQDFRRPARIVVGADSRRVAARVMSLYRGLPGRRILTDVHTAEMIKYASNAFLATRVSFINEIARICERLQADAHTVALGMGLDRRIGRAYLEPGIGYGGSCLPKDVRALAAMASRYDYHPELLHSVMAINRYQRLHAVETLARAVGDLRGRRIALLGLAFKPDTDDLRDAPSLEVALGLQSRGAEVRAYDPAVRAGAPGLPSGLELAPGPYAALRGAGGALIVTEWPQFRALDPGRIAEAMADPVVVDGRGVLDRRRLEAAGIRYFRLGQAPPAGRVERAATRVVRESRVAPPRPRPRARASRPAP